MDEFLWEMFKALAQGFFTAYFLSAMFVALAKKHSEDVIEFFDRVQNPEPERIKAKIEFVDNTMLLYTIEDESFVAQGNNWTELLANAKERFPYVIFEVNEEQLDKAREFNK